MIRLDADLLFRKDHFTNGIRDHNALQGGRVFIPDLDEPLSRVRIDADPRSYFITDPGTIIQGELDHRAQVIHGDIIHRAGQRARHGRTAHPIDPVHNDGVHPFE